MTRPADVALLKAYIANDWLGHFDVGIHYVWCVQS